MIILFGLIVDLIAIFKKNILLKQDSFQMRAVINMTINIFDKIWRKNPQWNYRRMNCNWHDIKTIPWHHWMKREHVQHLNSFLRFNHKYISWFEAMIEGCKLKLCPLYNDTVDICLYCLYTYFHILLESVKDWIFQAAFAHPPISSDLSLQRTRLIHLQNFLCY